MAPKKRKNPFNEEGAVNTLPTEGPIFEAAFNACVRTSTTREVDTDSIMANISKDDLKLILQDLETGKCQNDVKCRSIVKHVAEYKQMCEAEARIQSSKSKLEKLIGASFWKLGEEGNSSFQMSDVKSIVKLAIKTRPD